MTLRRSLVPDDTAQGKRLYLVRMAAVGLVSQASPAQPVMDQANDLVNRVIALHVAPWRQPTLTAYILATAAGLFIGLVIGAVLW